LAGQEEITKKINQLKEYLSHFVDNLRTDKQTVKILLKAQDFGTLETLRH
jgi:translation initiation factor IF-2